MPRHCEQKTAQWTHLSPLSYSTSRKFSPLFRTVAGLQKATTAERQQQQSTSGFGCAGWALVVSG